MYHDPSDLGSLILVPVIPKERTLILFLLPSILYRCAQSNRKHSHINTGGNWREPTSHLSKVQSMADWRQVNITNQGVV